MLQTSTTWYASGKTAQFNGLNVFYKRSGKGEPLVCIHGFPSSSWDFEPIWTSLIIRFDVIALDLVGLGKSDKPNKPISISFQADVIEALLTKEGIVNAHILCHDLGDTIAQELLARQLEMRSRVKWLSCVFLNGGIFPETHRTLFTQKLLLSYFGPWLIRLTSRKSLKKNFTKLFSRAHPPTDAFVNETWKLIAEKNGRSMIPRLLHYIVERRTHRERWVAPLINSIVPMRLINGIEDPVSGRHAADRFAQVVPKADIVYLSNTGHYPHIETPDEVIKAFFAFHDQLP